jgi:hypothetical protein
MLHSRLFGALVLLAFNSALSGCTLIGYGLGSAIDASGKQTFAPEVFAARSGGRNTVEPGTKLKLALRDGEVVEGKYLGVEQLPADEYVRVYGAARERYELQSELPEPGDTVTLALVTGRVVAGEFLGFERPHWVFFKREVPYRVAATDVVAMSDRHDRSVSGETLDRLVSSGVVPTMSALALEVVVREGSRRREEKRLIPLDSILSATHKPTTGRTSLMLIGLAFDVAGIAVAASGLDFGGGIKLSGG